MIRPDPIGFIDILAGFLLYFTVSPLPATVAQIHAIFLIYKGAGSMTPFIPLAGMPIFILGGAADIMSAFILYTGTPPILGGIKVWIAGILFIKGLFSLIALF